MSEKKKEKFKDDPFLPKKPFFRIDEVAQYFDVSESCIRVWLDHKILEKFQVKNVVRISRESILQCRFTRSNKN